MIKAMFLAGMGGFVGTCLRFLVGKMCHAIAVTTFPWGTFVVNVIGSLLIGVFFGLAERGNIISASMNVFLITGFCGGFTTFSCGHMRLCGHFLPTMLPTTEKCAPNKQN